MIPSRCKISSISAGVTTMGVLGKCFLLPVTKKASSFDSATGSITAYIKLPLFLIYLFPHALDCIFRYNTTALAKMFIAVFALMPNCWQSESKFFFSCASIRTVIDTCDIVFIVLMFQWCVLLHHIFLKLLVFCTILRNFAPIQYIFSMEDIRIDCNWAIVDVEVSLSDHKIHDIGALRYDGAVYHGCKKEDLFAFLNSVNFLCGHNMDTEYHFFRNLLEENWFFRTFAWLQKKGRNLRPN